MDPQNRTIGVLGGGQLGRMLVEAAHRLNIKVVVLDAKQAPAKQINALHPHIDGSFSDPDSIRKLAKECDLLTVEIEHVDTKVLEEIAVEGRVSVQPDWSTIRTIQDKYAQKEHLQAQTVPTAESIPLASNTAEELHRVLDKLGTPCMLKSRTQAYDGRGNYPIKSAKDVPLALETLAKRPLYAEKWAEFRMELAVMVVKIDERDSSAAADAEWWKQATLAYPTVETVHENSICKLVYAPARDVGPATARKAQDLARKAVAGFRGKGVFGVEMFVLGDDTLLVNEIAPRPHNSGHYTIEACPISQYDAHLRAILDLPFPAHAPSGSGGRAALESPGVQLLTPDTHAIMLNILGGKDPNSHITVGRQALTIPGTRLHLYGKGDARPGRKMGHVTMVAASMHEAETNIQPLVEACDTAQGKEPTSQATDVKTRSPTPVVAVTMGSDSDLPVLKPGIALLEELGIPYLVTITSAHRTPALMFDFARDAAARGFKVIIAAAGGAAHLPGMMASGTPLPVIGVPVKGSTLDGMDSLLSIVQMPRGVPVATVAINNSINAALLAARILGTSDTLIRQKIETYAREMEQGVFDKIANLDHAGWQSYNVKK